MSANESRGDSSPTAGTLVLRRLVGGTLGGICQALCSHPFDTVKSRLQAGVFPTVVSCVRETLHREGPYGFYKGVLPPILVCGVYNATLFSANQIARNTVRPRDSPLGSELSLPRLCVASVLTAPAAVAVLNPVEVIKIRLQLQTEAGVGAQYSSTMDCIVQTVRREGPMALYIGALPTLATRVVGLPFYFAAYEGTKRWMQGPVEVGGQRPPPPSTVTALASGVSAGYAFWTACYPFDYLKTRIQMLPRGATSMTAVFRDTVQQRGYLGLYSGFSACLLRSAPANASVWLAMEKTVALMERSGW